ncbi:MAG: hypothetical protein ACO2PL_12045 [Armatimonadota bacterium]|jgi:hypothetical protein
MFGGWSQLNENLQGDFSILQQISALRRENRFLKVGLVFCLVLSAMPYLTGFQPETISAKRVVTEKVKFVSDGKIEASIVVHPQGNGLGVLDRNGLPIAFFAKGIFGSGMGVYNDKGKASVLIADMPEGGSVGVFNKDGELAVSINIPLFGGSVNVHDHKGNILASMGATPRCGIIELKTPSGRTVWRVP